jgi:hypothetical protein
MRMKRLHVHVGVGDLGRSIEFGGAGVERYARLIRC